MKTKRTMKDIRTQYPAIIKIGYNRLQDLLCIDDPVAYTAGVYGWNADIYPVSSGVAICTGYHPFGNIKPDYETMEKFEKRAHEMCRDLWSNPEELAAHLHSLQAEFVREVCENA